MFFRFQCFILGHKQTAHSLLLNPTTLIFKSAPFLRLFLPFGSGIITAIYLKQPFPGLLFSLVLLVGLALLLLRQTKRIPFHFRWVYGLVLNLLFFGCGYQLTISKTELLSEVHYSRLAKGETKALVRLTDPVVEKDKSYKAKVEVLKIRKNEEWTTCLGKAILYLEKSPEAKALQYGEVLAVVANFQEIPTVMNPGEFNYRQYLEFHQVHRQDYVKSNEWSSTGEIKGNWLSGKAFEIRDGLLGIFQSNNVRGEHYAVLSALMLGHKEDLDHDTKRAYASAGAMHVLAVSGLHVGIIFMVLNFLIRLPKQRWQMRWLKALILIVSLWFYALLTGLSPSVLRAATMFTFVIVGDAIDRNSSMYNTLAASAVALLIYDPFLIMRVGFQLSYLAVIGIIFIQPRIYGFWEVKNPWLEKVWALTSVSLAAQLATFPLGLLFFHQFPNYFLISNLVVIPAATLVIYLGMLLFAFSWQPKVAYLIAIAIQYLIEWLNSFVRWIESLPFSITEGISITTGEAWLIYFILAFFMAFLVLRRVHYLRWALGLLVIFSGLQVFETAQQEVQRQFVIYHVKGTPVLGFINGREATLIAPQDFLEDEKRLLFHIRHHWWESGVQQSEYLAWQTSEPQRNLKIKEDFICFDSLKIAVVHPGNIRHRYQEPVEVDRLIISGNPYPDMEQIQANYRFDQLIIDTSNQSWRAKKWREQAAKIGVECHDTGSEGAWVERW